MVFSGAFVSVPSWPWSGMRPSIVVFDEARSGDSGPSRAAGACRPRAGAADAALHEIRDAVLRYRGADPEAAVARVVHLLPAGILRRRPGGRARPVARGAVPG